MSRPNEDMNDGGAAGRIEDSAGRPDRKDIQDRKEGARSVSPKRSFAKFFVITFICGIVGVTAGLGAMDSLLSSKPMDKAESGVQALEPGAKTEENLNILVPAEGVFETDPDLRDSRRVNVLLLGNTINNSKTKGLTDTIMLGSFDPGTKRIDVISVPRDTYYEREGYASGGFLKINSVLETEGAKAACESVHNVLQGAPVNYYAIIDYDGVENIVESIGGVPVDVPFNMRYTDTKQGLYIDIKKGQQRLDGEHAVQFLRYRSGYGDGDIGRVAAQQKFVKAAVREALGLNLPNVARTVIDNVDSDMDVRAMLYLATNAAGADLDNVKTHMLPGDDGRKNGLSFWFPADGDAIVDMMREVYTGVPATTGGAVGPATGGAVSPATNSAVSPAATGGSAE